VTHNNLVVTAGYQPKQPLQHSVDLNH